MHKGSRARGVRKHTHSNDHGKNLRKKSVREDELLDIIKAGDEALILILDQVQDPHNLGACMRTACAADVDAIIVNRSNSVSITSTVSKVACGAAEIVPLIQVKSLKKVLTWMGEYGINRIGTSENASENLFETNVKGHTLLVMGEEHSGLSKMAQKNCDNLLRIPIKGNLSSLNLSVATGICLFEINRKNSIS